MGEVVRFDQDRRSCLSCGYRCANVYKDSQRYRLLDLGPPVADFFRCPACGAVEVRALYVEAHDSPGVDGVLADLSHRLWMACRDV
jgi:predicted RNA-binding Zn-ribbon protein involved in translation (DUF1610 family)